MKSYSFHFKNHLKLTATSFSLETGYTVDTKIKLTYCKGNYGSATLVVYASGAVLHWGTPCGSR